MDEKKYAVEAMETNGPSKEDLNLKETISRLNLEKKNGRMVFIDGAPVMDDIITEETLKGYKKSILVLNELVGG